MSAIKVGDKVRWSSADRDDIYEVVLAVTSAHAFVVAIGESTVHRVPLSDLTLVESAPAAPASDAKAAEAERDAARAEVERLQGLLTVTDAALVRTGEQARKAEAEAKFGAGLAQDLSGELARLRERNARVRSILQRVDDEACKTNWSGNTDDLPESRPLDNEAVAMDMREALELLKETP